MKTILFLFATIILSTSYSQTTIKLPGDSGKSYKISGTYMGEMIRSTGGEDKKKEHYYVEVQSQTLIIWKHIIIIANGKTELLTKTSLPISEIDWSYFQSSNGEGPSEKKVSGKVHYAFSINAMRGKRFKQVKYTKETPSDVSVGDVQIDLNSKDEAEQFFKKVQDLKK